MRYSEPPPRRPFLLACACVLLLAGVASASEPSLTADFDGDGHRDRVTLDTSEPSIVRVWLSKTGGTTLIRSKTPVVSVVVTDLDGDNRPELIARGSSTRLQVWTRNSRGFRSYHPRRAPNRGLGRQKRHAVDDGPTDSPVGILWSGPSQLELSLSPRPRAPTLVSAGVFVIIARTVSPILLHAPFVPRPPPLPI